MIRNRIITLSDRAWWLAGGIPSAGCFAAYQPKGATYTTYSKRNLVDPYGPLDAVSSPSAPGWNAESGWTFNGTQYFKVAFIPAAGMYYSAIARFSNVSVGSQSWVVVWGGGRNTSTPSRFYLSPNYYGTSRIYGWSSGTGATVAGVLSAGVMCVAAGESYLNGVFEGGTVEALSAVGYASAIGALPTSANYATVQSYLTGNIQALALYDFVLSHQQVIAVTSAMNDL